MNIKDLFLVYVTSLNIAQRSDANPNEEDSEFSRQEGKCFDLFPSYKFAPVIGNLFLSLFLVFSR